MIRDHRVGRANKVTGPDNPPHPLASILVPVFNDEGGLLTCLNALYNQTYPFDRFDVVIIDNGSQPRVWIPDKFPFAFRIERCDIPGSYAARNAGARIASGEIFAFTDADCTPCPEWLERGISRLLMEQGKSIVGGEVLVTKNFIKSGASLYQHAVGFQQRENVENKGFSATANLFCTAQQFRDVGPFDERLLSGGDREWAWRARQRGLTVVFEQGAIVHTEPRTSLRAAMRQARRTAAGRLYIRNHNLDHFGTESLRPHRCILASLRWIVLYPGFSWWERAKVLNAAFLIKCVASVETIRLRLGGKAERR